MVATCFGLYWLGGVNRVADYRTLELNYVDATQQLIAAQGELVVLQTELAALRQRTELDELADKSSAEELKRLRHQLTGLRRELELYSSLADQTSSSSSVSVYQFVMETTAEATTYRYDLVLTQALTSNQMASGKVRIALAKEPDALVLVEHGFDFRVFEKFSGTLQELTAADLEDVQVVLTVVVDDPAEETVFKYPLPDLITAVAE
jgi:hypothetical protein